MMDTKKQALEKLKGHIKPDTSKWKEDAQWRRDNKGWLRKSQKIAFDILQAIRAQKKTQRDLAKEMNISPQQINKWVKGRENFTLETIDRLEKALGITLMASGQANSLKLPSLSFKTKYETITAAKGMIKTAEEGPRVIKLDPFGFKTSQQTG